MKISVIVPSCGRPATLESFLKSLQKAKKKLDLQTIVVINDDDLANVAEYAEIVGRFKSKLKILPLIFKKRLGSANARNEGIKRSKGDVIFFFDDDTEILGDYFDRILPLFKDGEVGAVGGAEIKKQSSKLHKVWFSFRKTGVITKDGDIISNFFYDPKTKEILDVCHLHGSNFGITKEAMKKVGFFDKNLYGTYRDETDFTFRIKKYKFRLLFLPSTGVIHKETVKGGNIPPQKKRQWAYWYYRNTSYFFFKDVYNGNPIYLISFLFRELFYNLLKAIIYKNPHLITQYLKIVEGYRLSNKK